MKSQGPAPTGRKPRFSLAEPKVIGDALGIHSVRLDVRQFARGVNTELEHGRSDPETDVTHDDPTVAGKIALAHLNRIPDCHARVVAMEREAGGAARTPPRKGL